MVAYYEVYSYNGTTSTTSTTSGTNWVSSTACSSNTPIVVTYEPPPYRRPKPPYIPFEPVRIPHYTAPPPPRPWPATLRRFRGDV